MTREPALRALVSAPRTNGVMPLADTPITTSFFVGSSRVIGARAFFVVVFGAFLGADDGVLAAGHDGLDQLGIGAEGRRHLGGLDDAEAAAGAGADEHDPPALAQRLGAHVGAERDAIALLLDRREHAAVFGEHQVDDAAGVELVDGERGGIDGFGGKGLPLRTGCGHYRCLCSNPEKLMLVLVLALSIVPQSGQTASG